MQEIGRYAINLMIRISCVKAKRGDDNATHKAVPAIPVHLVDVHPYVFIKDMLDPYSARVAMFWSAEKIEEVEDEHRDLRSWYESDVSVRKAIDATATSTTFDDDAWNHVPSWFST